MSTMRPSIAVLALTGALIAACGSREENVPAPAEPTRPPAVAPAEAAPPPTPSPELPAAAPAASAAPAPSTATPVPAKPKAVPAVPKATAPVRAPAPAAATAVTAPAPTVAAPAPPAPAPRPSPAGNASRIVDPGGEVAVAATKPGLTRIGAEKCRICHKVQHASWAGSAHAKRTPPLDCESCHGPGSEYKVIGVMKDAKKAREAGLVVPDAAFCGKCHKDRWDSALLAKVHAHKPTP